MPRIRSIKPEFFFDEELAKLSDSERLFFIGLWNHADRRGRLEDRPIYLKAHIFPYKDFDTELALTNLASKFIKRYEIDGKKYIQIIAFERHQRITGKEAELESHIPAPDFGEIRSNNETPEKHPRNTRVPRKGREKEGKGKDISDHQSVAAHIIATFKAKKGAAYPFSGEDGRVIKALLCLYDSNQIKALWDCFLSINDSWIQKVGHKIAEFRRQIPMLLDKSDWKVHQKKYQETGNTIEINLKNSKEL